MPKILKTPENKRKANKKYHDKHREDLKVYCKQYRKDHPGLNVRYSYGLTLEQVDEMLINQDHKCLICGVDRLSSTIYITPSWNWSWGGLFIYDDPDKGQGWIYPHYNHMVWFRPPVWHSTSMVTLAAEQPRLSIQIFFTKPQENQ